MEPAVPEKQNVPGSQMHVLNILFAVTVTFLVGIAVVAHWRTYDWTNKVVGAVLLLSLLIVGLPVAIRKKDKIDHDSLVFMAYNWLLLATVLFSH